MPRLPMQLDQPETRAFFAALASLSFAVGCASATSTQTTPGISHDGIESDEPARETKKERKPFPAFDEVRAWPLADSSEPVVSEGHFAGRFLGVLRVTSDFRETYLKLATSSLDARNIPDAAGVALFMQDRAGKPGPVLVMKRQGAWQYTLVSADGFIEEADPALCQRCHAEAPHAELFGPARLLAPAPKAEPPPNNAKASSPKAAPAPAP